VAFALHN